MNAVDDKHFSAPPLLFTQQAALKTWDLIKEDYLMAVFKLWLLKQVNYLNEPTAQTLYEQWLEDASLKLKVSVMGGGCHGFRYDFNFVTTINPSDTVIKQTIQTGSNNDIIIPIELVVDAISLQFLRGAEIDYQSDLQGERFILRNLKAKTTCGCGSSFGLE